MSIGAAGERRVIRSLFAVAAIAFCLCGRAHALHAAGSLGHTAYRVYAPDWSWQDRDINVLLVLRNNGPLDDKVRIELLLPPDKKDDFVVGGNSVQEVAVPAGGSVRCAFKQIVPKSGRPRQVYRLALNMSSPTGSASVDYPVQTIRGAVVSSGDWAVYLPAGLAAAWCIVFVAALRQLAPRGAWKVPGTPVQEPEHREPWIDQQPT